MLLNDADKQLILTALDAYGRQLTDSGSTMHIVKPVIALIQRVSEVDPDVSGQIDKLLALADMADAVADSDDLDMEGVDFIFGDEDDGTYRSVVAVKWSNKEAAKAFVTALDYPSAVMFYTLLDERLDGGDEEIDIVTEDANPVVQHELAKVLYGGPINVEKGIRARRRSIKTGTEDF